ncbi:MAG: DUF1343 domain-containing protein [Polyangiaceae bacterium]|nr:DUF1343 domain-containing protein [Polyangiaceae bacterium]
MSTAGSELTGGSNSVETSGEPAPSASVPAPSVHSSSSEEEEDAPVEVGATLHTRIDKAVMGAIERNEVPGAVVAVVSGDKTVFQKAYGLRAKEPSPLPMTLSTAFDLASLTKPIVTATLIGKLVETGKVRYFDPVSKHLPAFGVNGKQGITIAELLLHTSGLPADNALSDYQVSRALMVEKVLFQTPTKEAGQSFLYSDLGYIVLGELVGRLSETTLEAAAGQHLFKSLGMKSTTFAPQNDLKARAAPTEKLGSDFLQGTVHDPRARALGGVAGHAGLFSTADDLTQFAKMFLAKGKWKGETILAEKTISDLTVPRDIPGGKRAYWGAVSGNAVSHTGFTGTSIWLDLPKQLGVIILSNRVHPDGRGSADKLRREVIEAAVSEVKAKSLPTSKASVQTGVDVLESTGGRALRGRRVVLLTNNAARDAKGRRTVDALIENDIQVVSLLAPEHGITVMEEGRIRSGKDTKTGLTVHSLYGSQQHPMPEMFDGADTLVVDLPDVGARFFTYATTLGYCMKVAAKLKIRVVVLDRPNPVGGEVVEGPLLYSGKESFVALHRVTVRHGMTMGELAQLYNADASLNADLAVIKVTGWNRKQLFSETGLTWTPPSPNLKTPTQALLYSGVALVELTDVSVGRGTPKPFEQVGAPWINRAALLEELKKADLTGVTVRQTTFTPTASVHKGVLCKGVAFEVTSPAQFSPVRLGIALGVALHKLHPKEHKTGAMAALLANDAVLTAILSGKSVDEVMAPMEGEALAFQQRRKPYLLY